MKMSVEEGDIYQVEYGVGDTWKCPVCGFENETCYDEDDMEKCMNCKSNFKVYTVQEVKNIRDEQSRPDYQKISSGVKRTTPTNED